MTKRLKIVQLVLLGAALLVQPSRNSAQSANGLTSQQPILPQTTGATQPNSAQNPQAISQIGLLPLFAVDLQYDPSWVDATDVPTKSPQFSHSGVNDTFQKTWDALRPSGFNMIRFPVDLGDSMAPARLANLCIWAKANNVSLIPILKYMRTDRNGKAAMLTAVGTFVSAVVSRMHQQDASVFGTYTQIAYYELEDSMNHAGIYPKITPDVAQQLLLGSADALRNAETQALQGTQVQATPILIKVSFDYELIKQGEIAGVPLDLNAEQNARTSLKQYLAAFSSAANVDAVNVEWLPRSISSGDVDHFAPLLRDLKTALPTKQLSLTTGFSSAFNSADQQTQFFTLTFTNLADFRATDGAGSNFLGVVFRQALTGPQASAPTPPTAGDPTQWNWSDKAKQLLAMWAQGTPSDAMAWWVNKVQDNLGLVNLQTNPAGGQSVVPLPAQQAIQKISSTISQVSQTVPPPASIPGASPFAAQPGPPSMALPPGMTQNGMPPYTGGIGGQPPVAPGASPNQQFLTTILQQFTTQMATALAAKIGGGAGSGNQFSGYPPPGLNNGVPGQVSPYGTNPGIYGATTNPSSQTFPQSSPLTSPTQVGTSVYSSQPQQYANTGASPIMVGPQDISIDSASVVPGQTVNIVAQIHNTSLVQDISGLTVTLTSSTGSLPNQPMQSGIFVAHSGTTPVQLGWMAPSMAGPVQLLLQVSDPTGAQLATAPVPTITVNGPATNGSVGAPVGTSVGSAGVNSNGVSQPATTVNSLGQPVNSPTSTPAVQPTSTTPSQPQIVFFGTITSSALPAAGQLAPLLVQLVNSSAAPQAPAQAQLFIDGNSSQTQSLGPLLPSQTRSALFAGIAATPGTHSAKVLVTTSDGGSASATASVSAVAPTAASPSGTTTPQTGTTPGTSTNTVARNTSQPSTPSSVATSPVTSSSAVPLQTTTPANPASTPSATATAPPGTAASASTPTLSSKTVASTPASMTRSIVGSQQLVPPASASGGVGAGGSGTNGNVPQSLVRTITPNNSSNPAGATGKVAGTKSIAGGTGSSGVAPPSQTSKVRTITPGNTPGSATTAKSGSATRSPTQSSSGTQVRTITPGGTKSGSGANTVSASSSGKSSAGSGTGVSSPVKKTAQTLAKQGTIDLSISNGNLQISPGAPRAGQAIGVTASVQNLGTAPAQGASVVFRLLAGSQVVAASSPIVFNIAARGTFQANWSTAVPSGRQFKVVAVVAAKGDVNTANNQAALTFNVAAAPAPPHR